MGYNRYWPKVRRYLVIVWSWMLALSVKVPNLFVRFSFRSPKNVVPITGIIALALSVAYTFIVWDRIPFASANLVTALTAVRENPSIVFVALVFQALMLGWSIYFCVVVIGVYDSIHEAKLAVSHQWAAVIYTLLGISFYWTFQVVQVRIMNLHARECSARMHLSTISFAYFLRIRSKLSLLESLVVGGIHRTRMGLYARRRSKLSSTRWAPYALAHCLLDQSVSFVKLP